LIGNQEDGWFWQRKKADLWVNLSTDVQVILKYDSDTDDAFLDRLGHGFGAVADSQLLKDGLNMSFYRALTDAESSCDQFVDSTFRHELKYL
jgi:hypothetical protein